MKSPIFEAGQMAGFEEQITVALIGEEALKRYEDEVGYKLNPRERATFFDGWWKGIA